MNIFLAGLARYVILMSLFVFCCQAKALDQSSESSEIQELRSKVEALKKRVHELESAQSANPGETSKPAKIKGKKVTGNPWHSLTVSVSKEEVISILGKPGKIDKWKTGEAWYFPNPKGGEVDFDANGNVSGWLEP